MKKIVVFILVSTFVFAQKSSISLKEYVGKYKMESFFEICTITEKEDELYAEVDTNGLNKLIKTDKEDVFKSTSTYGTVFTFTRNDKKEVNGVSLHLMDNDVAGTRIE
jgi:Domain of unknown function (DUF3471)